MKTSMPFRQLKAGLLAAVPALAAWCALLNPQAAVAQTAYTLSTLTSGNTWTTTTLWNPNGDPGATIGDSAILPLGTLGAAWSMNLSSSPNLTSLTVSSAGSYGVTLNPGTPATSTLTLHSATPAFTNNVLSGQTLTIAAPFSLDTANTLFTNNGTGNLTLSTPTNGFFANLNPAGGLGSATPLTLNNVYTNLPPLTQLKTGAGQLTLALIGTATNTFFTNQNAGSLGGNGYLQISSVDLFSSAAGMAQMVTNNSTSALELDLDNTTPSAFLGSSSFGGLGSVSGKTGAIHLRYIHGTNTLASSVSINTVAAGSGLALNLYGYGNASPASAVVNGGTWNVPGNLALCGGMTLNLDANLGGFTNGNTLIVGSGNSGQLYAGGNNTVNWNTNSNAGMALANIAINSQGGSTGIFNLNGGSLTNSGTFALGSTSHAADNSSSYLNVLGGTLGITNSGGLTMPSVTTGGAQEYAYLTISNTGVLNLPAGSAFKLGSRNVSSDTAATKSQATVSLGGGTLLLGTPVARQTVTATTGAGTAQVQFYFNGGTLQASANLAQVFTGFGTPNSAGDAVYVASGGAVINNGGFNVGISNNLLAASGSPGGLTTYGAGVLTLAGTNNYAGATTNAGGTLVLASPYAISNSVLVMNGGSLLFSNGTTFTCAGLAATNAGAGFNLALTNTAGAAVALTVGANNSSASYAGTLSDGSPSVGGALIKIGGGTQTLTGANTYTGATTVSNGTLAVSSAQSGGGAFTVADGADLNVTRNASVTSLNLSSLTLGSATGATNTFTYTSGNPAGALITAGTLTLNGVNALAVAGPNFTVGQFPLIKYTTQNTASGSISATPFSLPAGMTATISNNIANSSYDLVISVAPALVLTWQGNQSANWNAANNWTNALGALATYSDGSPVVLDDTAPGATSISLPGTYQPLSMAVNNTVNTYMLSGAGSLAGAMSLTKTGAGALALAEANTYAGSTTINGGTLTVTNGGAINSPAAALTVQTGTLTLLTNASITTATLLVTNNTLTATNSVFKFSGGTLTTSNILTGLAASIITSATSNSVWNINGSWTMNGGTNLVTSLWTGGGAVGTVNVGSNANNLTMTVNSNAILRLGTSATAANNMIMYIGNSATNDLLIVNGGLVTNVDLVNIGAGNGEAYNGLLVTNGGLCYIGGQSVMGGTGSYLAVAGTNGAGRRATYDQGNSSLYYGVTTVSSGGTIQNLGFNLDGSGQSLTVTNGGQANLSQGVTLGRYGSTGADIVVGGLDPATSQPATLADNGQAMTIGGGDATDSTTKSNFLSVGWGGQVLWSSGAINVGPAPGTGIEQGVGNYMVINNGGFVSNSAASYIGGNTNALGNYVAIGGAFGTTNAAWNLGGKTLTIGNSTAVPGLATNNYLQLSTGGMLTNVASVILGGVSNNIYFNGGTLSAGSSTNLLQTNATAVNCYVVVQGGGANLNDNGFNVTNTAFLIHDPALGGTADGGLTKRGPGTLVLGGVNTYTGPTTISAGILALPSGSLANTTSFTLAAGATLDLSAQTSPYALLGSSPSQSLAASGAGTTTGTTAAAIKGPSGGTVSLGSQPIILNYNGSQPALFISQGALSLNGNAFTVNTSSPLSNGSYPIVQQANGSISSSGTYSVGGTAIGAGKSGSIQVSGGSVNLIIQTATTTTLTLSAGSNPASYGSSLSFQAVVSPTPDAGTVQFMVNGANYGSAISVSGGVANLTTTQLPYSAIAYTIAAVYSGDTTYAGSGGNLSQTVNQAVLTVTPNAVSVIYNGTTLNNTTYSDSTGNYAIIGFQNLETITSAGVTLSGSLAFNGTTTTAVKDVGTYSQSQGTLAMAAANYTMTFNNPTPNNYAITPKTLTAIGTLVFPASKVYDGGTTATPTSGAAALPTAEATGGSSTTSDGIPYTGNGDAVSLTGTAAYNYPSKDVATAETVTESGLSLTGTGSGNYTLAAPSFSGKAITALPVVLTGTRPYDGTTTATFSILTVANAIGGDSVEVASGSGTLTAATAGAETIASVGSLALGNNEAGDYTLTGASGLVTISQAGISSFTLNSSENPSGYFDSLTFTATNLPTDATGSVIFASTNGPISTNAVSGGLATSLSVTNLPRGTNVISATYSGDTNYLGATTSLNQIVTNHPPVASVMIVTRTDDLALLIPLTEIATNWSDADGDPVELTGINLQSTNGINLIALNWGTNADGSIVTTNAYAFIGYTNAPNVADQISYSISDGQGGTNIGYIEIVINNNVTGTNSITALSFGTGSNTVTAYGIPLYYYILERATNLSSPVWVDIQTNQAATNGLINATDTFWDVGGVPPSPSAFYQLKWQP